MYYSLFNLQHVLSKAKSSHHVAHPVLPIAPSLTLSALRSVSLAVNAPRGQSLMSSPIPVLGWTSVLALVLQTNLYSTALWTRVRSPSAPPTLMPCVNLISVVGVMPGFTKALGLKKSQINVVCACDS